MGKRSVVSMVLFVVPLVAWASVANATYTDYIGGGHWDASMSVTAAPAAIHEHYRPELCVNGAGLDASGLLHNPGFNIDTWQCYYDGTTVTHHAGGIEGSCWIEFDFGQVYPIDNMWIWNLNEDGYTGRGLRRTHFEYSLDGVDWTQLTYTTIDESVYIGGPYPVDEVVDFGGLEARYVLLTADVLFGNWGAGGLRGLAEVRFNLVPEPVTMFLLGLGAVCLVRRKRQ